MSGTSQMFNAGQQTSLGSVQSSSSTHSVGLGANYGMSVDRVNGKRTGAGGIVFRQVIHLRAYKKNRTLLCSSKCLRCASRATCSMSCALARRYKHYEE